MSDEEPVIYIITEGVIHEGETIEYVGLSKTTAQEIYDTLYKERSYHNYVRLSCWQNGKPL